MSPPVVASSSLPGCRLSTSRPCSTLESVASCCRCRPHSARCSPGFPSCEPSACALVCLLAPRPAPRPRPRRWLAAADTLPCLFASLEGVASGSSARHAHRTCARRTARGPCAVRSVVTGCPDSVSPLGAPCVQPASPRTSLDRAVVVARGRSLAPRRPVPPDGGPPVCGRLRSALRGRAPCPPGRSRLRRAPARSATSLPVTRSDRLPRLDSAAFVSSVRPFRACFEGRCRPVGSCPAAAAPKDRCVVTARPLSPCRGSRTACVAPETAAARSPGLLPPPEGGSRLPSALRPPCLPPTSPREGRSCVSARHVLPGCRPSRPRRTWVGAPASSLGVRAFRRPPHRGAVAAGGRLPGGCALLPPSGSPPPVRAPCVP
jgi:hypothetical protein